MKKLILAISTIFCLSGCNYLDIVPDDTPLLEDAFKNEQTAEGFMYSCYAQIPDYTNFRSNIAWLTTPEVVYSYHWIDAWFASIGLQQGKYSASNPVVDVWRPSYRGIRQCYTFLDNMEGVPGVNISPEDLVQRKKAVSYTPLTLPMTTYVSIPVDAGSVQRKQTHRRPRTSNYAAHHEFTST